VLVHDGTRGPGLLSPGIVPHPGVRTRTLGYCFLHTLELFDDRVLLVYLDRSWLRLAA
jgi:hypothetical protein